MRKTLTTKIRDDNKEIDKSIKKILSKMQTAQNVIKALGYIDDVVNTVRGILP